jgi:argininosuccinate lyase
LDKLCRLLACVIGTAEVNKDKLRERAKASFATITELADTLVRTDALSFRKAHHIASHVVKNAISKGISADEVTLALVNEAALEVICKPLLLNEVRLRQSLDPDYFVSVRSQPGGPNQDEVRRMIDVRMHQHDDHQSWLKAVKEKSEQSLSYLDSVLAEWCS